MSDRETESPYLKRREDLFKRVKEAVNYKMDVDCNDDGPDPITLFGEILDEVETDAKAAEGRRVLVSLKEYIENDLFYHEDCTGAIVLYRSTIDSFIEDMQPDQLAVTAKQGEKG